MGWFDWFSSDPEEEEEEDEEEEETSSEPEPTQTELDLGAMEGGTPEPDPVPVVVPEPETEAPVLDLGLDLDGLELVDVDNIDANPNYDPSQGESGGGRVDDYDGESELEAEPVDDEWEPETTPDTPKKEPEIAPPPPVVIEPNTPVPQPLTPEAIQATEDDLELMEGWEPEPVDTTPIQIAPPTNPIKSVEEVLALNPEEYGDYLEGLTPDQKEELANKLHEGQSSEADLNEEYPWRYDEDGDGKDDNDLVNPFDDQLNDPLWGNPDNTPLNEENNYGLPTVDMTDPDNPVTIWPDGDEEPTDVSPIDVDYSPWDDEYDQGDSGDTDFEVAQPTPVGDTTAEDEAMRDFLEAEESARKAELFAKTEGQGLGFLGKVDLSIEDDDDDTILSI